MSVREQLNELTAALPDYTLSQLVASFIGSQCQGIPLALFVA